MCIIVYIASRRPLPVVPWQQDAPAFNVSELRESEEPVRRHLAMPHVRQAGSHTNCGCGFNEGRQHPQAYDDPVAERTNALMSSSLLADYIRAHRVEQIYSCWSGDESQPKEFERTVTPEALVADDFFFRERELLTVRDTSIRV